MNKQQRIMKKKINPAYNLLQQLITEQEQTNKQKE